VGVTAIDTDAVHDYLVAEHAEVIEAVRACAVAAATAGTDDAGRSDTSAVRRGIEACLREAGVWEDLPSVLVGCVERTGERLGATPVPAPPYVAATVTGVVLRATLDTGRLVVAVDALTVDRKRDGGTTGVGLRPRPADASTAELACVSWRT
jgi:hypothetical protein